MNGTYVNNARLVQGKRKTPTPGDEISLGRQIKAQSSNSSDAMGPPVDAPAEEDCRWIYRAVEVGTRALEEVSHVHPSQDRVLTFLPLHQPAGAGIFAQYHFMDVLGKGSFAVVKRAVEIATGTRRAIKVSSPPFDVVQTTANDHTSRSSTSTNSR